MQFRALSFPASAINPVRLARPATALLVIAVAWSLGQATWLFVPAPKATPDLPPAAVVAIGPESGIPVRDLGTVASLHLFGTAASSEAPVRTAVIDAPETRLDLTLRGLVAASDPNEAFAIIARGKGDERTYKVGADLPGGAVVHEIHPDRVILERGGRLETLTLPKDRVADVPDRRDSSSSQPVSAVGRELSGLRKRILSNPQEAMQMVQVQPVMQGGRLRGYRIKPRAQKDLFRKAGLRPGDIVTSVNGVAVNDPAKLGDVIKQLSTAGSFDVTVDRGGSEQTVQVRLE